MRRDVGGDMDKVGDEDHQRLRIRRAEIALQRGELVLFGAARIELAHIADENHLEGRHQRGCLRAVQHLEDGGCGQVQVGEAKIPQIRRHKGLEHGGAAAVQKEDLVAGQHVARLERPFAGRRSLDLGHKAACGGKSCAPAHAGQRTDLRTGGGWSNQSCGSVSWVYNSKLSSERTRPQTSFSLGVVIEDWPSRYFSHSEFVPREASDRRKK